MFRGFLFKHFRDHFTYAAVWLLYMKQCADCCRDIGHVYLAVKLAALYSPTIKRGVGCACRKDSRCRE